MTGPAAKKTVFNSAPSGARWPLIAPSVLSADFAFIERDCRQVLEAGADVLHLDVMDGHFVPNLTMGPDMCRGLRKAFPNAMLDVHLMVMHPEQYVEPFAKAGANQFTFHIGGYQYPNNSIQQLDLKTNSNDKIVIDINLSKLLSEIKLNEFYEVMSPNEKAMDMAKKISTVFHISK